jgi:hypothetical protein
MSDTPIVHEIGGNSQGPAIPAKDPEPRRGVLPEAPPDPFDPASLRLPLRNRTIDRNGLAIQRTNRLCHVGH